MGLRGVELRRLLRMNLPAMFFNILIAITRIFALNPISRDLNCVEMFSGKATIRDAFRASGGRALGYDITYDPRDNDLNSVTGFCVAVVLTMRLKSRSVQWWATVCSSWVWMSRNTCERSKNRSGGNRQVPCVKSANCQVARMALISALGLSRGTSWGLEQPSSSLMRYSWHVRFLEKVAKILGLSFTDIACDMGAYNADTKKPKGLCHGGMDTDTGAPCQHELPEEEEHHHDHEIRVRPQASYGLGGFEGDTGLHSRIWPCRVPSLASGPTPLRPDVRPA